MAKTEMELIKEIVESIRIPKSQNNHPTDYVMWRQEGRHSRHWGANTACFGGVDVGDILTTHRFECRSFEKNRMLPQKVYLGTMSALRKVGLIAPGMHYWVGSKHARFLVPTGFDYDRHTVFAALSLYRHCDAQPYTMYLAWRLYQALQEFNTPYLQCLHYALGQLGYCGHTFISMATYEGATGPLNPGFGWALAFFGSLSYEARASLIPVNVTTTMFCNLATVANPVTQRENRYGHPNPTVGQPAKHGIGDPAWRVESAPGILHPQLSPLYTNPQDFRDPESFARLVEGVCVRGNLPIRAPRWVRPKVRL